MSGTTLTPPVKAVFLDFGDTLVDTEPLYIERLRISFGQIGVDVDYDRMEKAFLEADARSAAALIDRKPFPPDAWKSLFAAVMVETLGVDMNSRQLMLKVSDRMAKLKPKRKLVKGAREFLDFCVASGLRLALLSNNDGRTENKCDEVGIRKDFELIMDSTIEGIEKPNPEFFLRALDRMKLKNTEALHVGDLLGCDVMGAKKAGVRVAWLHDRKYTPNIKGVAPDFRVKTLAELADILKGGTR